MPPGWAGPPVDQREDRRPAGLAVFSSLAPFTASINSPKSPGQILLANSAEDSMSPPCRVAQVDHATPLPASDWIRKDQKRGRSLFLE
jgi:hypothetical protein